MEVSVKSLTFSCLICALSLYFGQKLLRKGKFARGCQNRKKLLQTPKVAQKLPSTIGTNLVTWSPFRPAVQGISHQQFLWACSQRSWVACSWIQVMWSACVWIARVCKGKCRDIVRKGRKWLGQLLPPQESSFLKEVGLSGRRIRGKMVRTKSFALTIKLVDPYIIH